MTTPSHSGFYNVCCYCTAKQPPRSPAKAELSPSPPPPLSEFKLQKLTFQISMLKVIHNSIHSPYQIPGSSMSHPINDIIPVCVYTSVRVCVCTCNALCPILTHSWVTRSDQDSSTTTHAYDVVGKFSHCSAELELRILDLWLGCITY